jgi:phage/plasmid primase-like uncharacterized protein
MQCLSEAAIHLWGKPNSSLSDSQQLRFGRRGSKALNIETGQWFDHEAGHGGGPVGLLTMAQGLSAREAMQALYGNNKPAKQIPDTPTPPTKTQAYARRVWQEVCNREFHRDDDHIASHPYARRKKITWAAGAGRGRVSGRVVGQGADCIVVPMRDWRNNLSGVECINGAGTKQTFGNKGVLKLGIPEDSKAEIVVCEGWADGVAIFRSLPPPASVIVRFGKGVVGLVQEVQQRFPDNQVWGWLDHD